jgi:hypothetical protein
MEFYESVSIRKYVAIEILQSAALPDVPSPLRGLNGYDIKI